MTQPTLTYTALKAMSPCPVAFRRAVKQLGGKLGWGDGVVTAARARRAGVNFDSIAWVATNLAGTDADVSRRMQMWSADCLAHVLTIFERAYPGDTRPREAITLLRMIARGRAGDAQRIAALASMRATLLTTKGLELVYIVQGLVLALSKCGWEAPAGHAAMARCVPSDIHAEQCWQFDRLIAWLGPDEPAIYPLPRRPR
jgi:hypothetical protein